MKELRINQIEIYELELELAIDDGYLEMQERAQKEWEEQEDEREWEERMDELG